MFAQGPLPDSSTPSNIEDLDDFQLGPLALSPHSLANRGVLDHHRWILDTMFKIEELQAASLDVAEVVEECNSEYQRLQFLILDNWKKQRAAARLDAALAVSREVAHRPSTLSGRVIINTGTSSNSCTLPIN